MRVTRGFYVGVPLILFALILAGAPVRTQDASGEASISGTVKSSAGQPMAGVTVSMRGAGQTITTSVFTDEQGNYRTPPLPRREYALWAQAVGFERAETTVQPATGQVQQVAELTLRALAPTDPRFDKQLSGVELFQSMGDDTAELRRGKRLLANNCTGCHNISWVLRNKWDERGWDILVRTMSMTPDGNERESDTMANPVHGVYREELAAFLANVRGPKSTMTPRLLPRPTGEAARVVITEYDLPRAQIPSPTMRYDGSDWSLGTPGRHEGRAVHTMSIDSKGIIWFSDDRSVGRTVGRLDPSTGEVQDFMLPNMETGGAVATHGVAMAPNDMPWLTSSGGLFRYNPQAADFDVFNRPGDMPRAGGTNVVDSKGNGWVVAQNGAIKVDPLTGEYTYYEAVDAGRSGHYGIAVDALDNAYFTQPGIDKVGVVNGQTGEVSEVGFEPQLEDALPRDRDNYTNPKIRASQNAATPMHKCPRRIGGDTHGEYVYVALYCSDKIASIHMRTHEVKEYTLPVKYAGPYAIVVDGKGMVWVNMMNTDMVAKFNPQTEQFTMYHLPIRGSDVRYVGVDNRTDPPTIYAASNRVNKIIRLQFPG